MIRQIELIQQAAPKLRIAHYQQEISQAIQSVLSSEQYILGEWVEAFEKSFADYCGAANCVAVNSGTDALEIALRALGLGPGDEVVTVAMTAPGTALAIINAGAEPRFVDIDPDTLCMDLQQLESCITPRTAAIIPVHLYGYPMDMAPIMAIANRHSIMVVEDCAHAHGARRDGKHVGTTCHAAAFSFYPTKNLGCVGDGGAIITNDHLLANQMRKLRACGTTGPGDMVKVIGPKSRLDALQAGILSVLLKYLDDGNKQRAETAGLYRKRLDTPTIRLQQEHHGHVYHQFVLNVDNRNALHQYLRDVEGIVTGKHYATPLHRHPVFDVFCPNPLPITEWFADRVLSLPIQPEIALTHRENIVKAVLRGVNACRAS